MRKRFKEGRMPHSSAFPHTSPAHNPGRVTLSHQSDSPHPNAREWGHTSPLATAPNLHTPLKYRPWIYLARWRKRESAQGRMGGVGGGGDGGGGGGGGGRVVKIKVKASTVATVRVVGVKVAAAALVAAMAVEVKMAAVAHHARQCRRGAGAR